MKRWIRNLCDMLEVFVFSAILIIVVSGLAYTAAFFLFKLIRWIFYL